MSKDLDPDTGKERHIVIYHFEENGEKKMYVVPVKNKQGGVHYLIQRLSEFNSGDELILEGKKRGIKNYINVVKLADGQEIEMDEINEDDIPVIDADEDKQDDSTTEPTKSAKEVPGAEQEQ